MFVVSSGPDWATIMTAFGTVGAVVVALGIAVWSERRTDRRLAVQREHSDAQLAEERRLAGERLQAERDSAREREQLAEAYAVQVVMGDWSTGRPGERGTSPSRVVVIVINHSRYTITRIDAQLRLSAGGSASLVQFDGRELVPSAQELDTGLGGGLGVRLAKMHTDRLTPWDPGLRFETDLIGAAHLPGAYPVVRWADQWGTRWEHRRGEVRQIAEDADWEP